MCDRQRNGTLGRFERVGLKASSLGSFVSIWSRTAAAVRFAEMHGVAAERLLEFAGAQTRFGIVVRYHYDRQIDTTRSWINCSNLSSPLIARL
jgi:hypothetical protein